MAHSGHSYKTKGYKVFQGISPRMGDLGPVVGRKTADTAETSLKGELLEKYGKGWRNRLDLAHNG